jgi:hypothetical protein
MLAGVLLFVQFLVAAHACTPTERSATYRAMTVASHASCHHQAAHDVAACLTHCSAADQSADVHQVSVCAMPAVALLTVRQPAESSAVRIAALAAADSRGGDPPIPIRFQVFRT